MRCFAASGSSSRTSYRVIAASVPHARPSASIRLVDLVVGEGAPQRFDSECVPAVALAGTGRSLLAAGALLREPTVEARLGRLAEGQLVIEHAPADPTDDRLEPPLDIVARGRDGVFDRVDVDEVVEPERGGLFPELLRRREVAVRGGHRDEGPVGGLGHRGTAALPHELECRAGERIARSALAGSHVRPSCEISLDVRESSH